jgi:hypothetical protein
MRSSSLTKVGALALISLAAVMYAAPGFANGGISKAEAKGWYGFM